MRSQTGGAMSMCLSIVHGRSSKRKLKTKISTKVEFVGVSEYLPYNIWQVYLLKDQGYIIKNNDVLQDNQSAMRMEKNERNSCTDNSRHIDIQYFFVKDRVDKGEIKIKYCPTNIMLANFYKKPLQGKLFKVFKDIIMGHVSIQVALPTIKILVNEQQMKERVENEKNIEQDKNHK